MGNKRKQKELKRKRKQARKDAKRPAQPHADAQDDGFDDLGRFYGDPDPFEDDEDYDDEFDDEDDEFDDEDDEDEDSPAAVQAARQALRLDRYDPEENATLARRAGTAAEFRLLLQRALVGYDTQLRSSLGSDVFERLAGRFWTEDETRDSMIARLDLAEALWREGRAEEALAHFDALLELSPNDELMVRASAASAALEAGRFDRVDALVARYADDIFCWLPWTRALAQFARAGAEDPRTRELLDAALAEHPHAPQALVRKCPERRPTLFKPGSAEEAAGYVLEAQRVWERIPGALAWLYAEGERTGLRLSETEAKRAERLRELPQVEEAWRVDARQLPPHLATDEGLAWASLVVSAETGTILASELGLDAPDAETAWALVQAAISRPLAGAPRRPRSVHLPQGVLPEVAGRASALGLDARWSADDGALDPVFGAMAQSMSLQEQYPAWTQRSGVTDAQVRALCAAGRDFFEALPWHLATDRFGFVLTPADDGARALLGDAPRCAVVMGAAGETYGLALYDTLEQARLLPGGPEPAATTLTFDPVDVPHPHDVARFKALDCALVSRQAVPLVMRLEHRERPLVAPSPPQLEQLAAALQLVPRALLEPAMPCELVWDGPAGPAQVRVERVGLRGGADSIDYMNLPLLQPAPGLADTFQEILGHVLQATRESSVLGSGNACLVAASRLCADPESPARRASPRAWAAGLVHAWLRVEGRLAGETSADYVAEAFGLRLATVTKKARAVDALMDQVFAEAQRASF